VKTTSTEMVQRRSSVPFSNRTPKAPSELKLIQYTPRHLAQIMQVKPMAIWADVSTYMS